MGYRLNRLDEPVFIAVSKPLLTDFGIHRGLESCDGSIKIGTMFPKTVFQKTVSVTHKLRTFCEITVS